VNKSVLILIIRHTPTLDSFEEISLRQCEKILGHYPIKIILPKGCDNSRYVDICPNAIIEYVKPEHLESLRAYNQFRLKPQLYLKNFKYQFVLFYELDSFVFEDQLLEWCDAGYDYIGAPWFKGFHNSLPDAKFIFGGNGGFSLRNVKKTFLGNFIDKMVHPYNYKLKL
jgi:hypothetical protein